MFVRDEKELAKAIEEEQDTIEIEGDLANKTFRIKATGKVAWCVCIGAIGIAVAATLAAPVTGGASLSVKCFVAPVVATSLGGFSVATSAIMIAVAAGGVGVLNKLRKYNIEKVSENKIRLTRE